MEPAIIDALKSQIKDLRKLLKQRSDLEWAIADILLELYNNGVDIHSFTLLDMDAYLRKLYVRVARENKRREPRVSFAHYIELCGVPPSLKARWLAKAAEGYWTVSRLRKELRLTQVSLSRKVRVLPLNPDIKKQTLRPSLLFVPKRAV